MSFSKRFFSETKVKNSFNSYFIKTFGAITKQVSNLVKNWKREILIKITEIMIFYTLILKMFPTEICIELFFSEMDFSLRCLR